MSYQKALGAIVVYYDAMAVACFIGIIVVIVSLENSILQ